MDPTEDSNRFPDDCLPPKGEHGSRDALYKAINEWAAPRGYGFVIAKESVDRSTWCMSHRSGSGFDTHNHEPSFSQCAHPVHRQLSAIDRSTVYNLANAGIARPLSP